MSIIKTPFYYKMELDNDYTPKYLLNDIDIAKLGTISMENTIIQCLFGSPCDESCYKGLSIAIVSVAEANNDPNVMMTYKFIDYLLYWYPGIKIYIFTNFGKIFQQKYINILNMYIDTTNSAENISNTTGNISIVNMPVIGDGKSVATFQSDNCIPVDVVYIISRPNLSIFNIPLCTKKERPNAIDNTYIISGYNSTSYEEELGNSSINTGIHDGTYPIMTYEYTLGTESNTETKTMNFGMLTTNDLTLIPLPEKFKSAITIGGIEQKYSILEIDMFTDDSSCGPDGIIKCLIDYFDKLYKYKKAHNIREHILLFWRRGYDNVVNRPNKGGCENLKYLLRNKPDLAKVIDEEFKCVEMVSELNDKEYTSVLQHSLPILFLQNPTSISMYISSRSITRDTSVFFAIKASTANFANKLGINPNENRRVTKRNSPDTRPILKDVPCCGQVTIKILKNIQISQENNFRFMGRYIIDATLVKAKNDYENLDHTCVKNFMEFLGNKFTEQNNMISTGELPKINIPNIPGQNIKINYSHNNQYDVFNKNFVQNLLNPGKSAAKTFFTNFRTNDGPEKQVFVKYSKITGGIPGTDRVRGPECVIEPNSTISCSSIPINGQVSEVITMTLIYEKINNIIKADKSPNFVYTYSVEMVTDPKTLNPTSQDIGLLSYQKFIPNAVGFRNYIINNENDPQLFVNFLHIVVQILANLLYLQRMFGFVHNDFHGGNVMIETLPTPIKQNYCLKGDNYVANVTFISNLRIKIIDFDAIAINHNGVRYGSGTKGIDDANTFSEYRDWLWLMQTMMRDHSNGKYRTLNNPNISNFVNLQCEKIIGLPCNSKEATITDPRQEPNRQVNPQNRPTRSGLKNNWLNYIFTQLLPDLLQNGVITQIPQESGEKIWCS